MADSEGFLGRWSRLKREAEERPPVEEPAPPPDPVVEVETEREPLPPIESLGADSDYTRFLAPDVPAEVARLALRKAWVSDPKIADFRGFAEYDWDCNAPGYGALRPTDNIAELLDAVFGDTPPEPPEAVPVAEAPPEEPAAEPPEEPVDVAEKDSLEEKREQGSETSDATRC